uniref:Histone deacetylase 14 n=1 Tax=Tanacetum cinerariifolium TaxID=118510 RepID=A0A6L2NUA1_TANCI|nr:hypothetical protein [Tanacetum cinerariifolium]
MQDLKEEFVQAIQTFLTDKTNLGSPTKKGRNDKPHVIPYYRFTKLIIYHLGRIHNIYQRSTSPYHLTKEDLRLGNLKFFPKGEKDEVFGMPVPNELISNNINNATYYNAYLEMVAKHNRRVAAEKEGKKKPTTAKQPKPNPAYEKLSKPAPVPKLKATKETLAKPPPVKPLKMGKVLKTHKGKSKGDEHDVELAIHMSLESFQAQSQAHVGEVTIQKLVAEATRPLQVVKGKGGSTGPSAQPQDDASANIVHESPSPANAETGVDSDKTTSGGDTEILQINEDQGKDVDTQEFMEEDEAGPDPGVSRVALTGPNPKPTHEEFIDTMYLDVHGSLKLPADKHVILEEPLSTSGTLSSMKSLDDAYTFRDQFLNDKSTKDEPVPATTHEPIFTATTTTLKPLPPPPQQSTSDFELAALEQKLAAFEQKSKTLDNTTQNLGSRRSLQKELLEADIKEILHQRMFESGSYKSRRDNQDPPPPPPGSDLSKSRRHDSGASRSTQPPTPQSSTWKKSNTRETLSNSSRQQSASHSKQPIKDVHIPDNVNVLDSKDTDTAHLPKLKTRPDWMKPMPKEDRPATPEPYWIEKKKLSKIDSEGPAFNAIRPFYNNSISLQFQTKQCHRMLTDQVDLVNPEGYRIMPGIKNPLPLRDRSGQVTIESQYFFNKDLEYLVSGDKGRRSTLSISKLKVAHYLDFGLEELVMSLWIESEQEYNIGAAYGISHLWFKRKEFYITRHDAPSDHSKVRSHMRILSVISLKIYARYMYAFLKEIVLRRADYKEYKISEANFKILHPNEFEDLYLLHLQDQLKHLTGDDKVHLFMQLTYR